MYNTELPSSSKLLEAGARVCKSKSLLFHTQSEELICNLQWCFQRYSVFIVDSRQLYKFYTCKMATVLSKLPRSHWSNFVHDLVTVDFHQTDIRSRCEGCHIINNCNSIRADHRQCCCVRYGLDRNSVCVRNRSTSF